MDAFLCDLAKARRCILPRTLHRSESFSSWPSCDLSHLGKACCCSLAKCTEAAGRNRRSRRTAQVDACLRDRAESRRCILLGVLSHSVHWCATAKRPGTVIANNDSGGRIVTRPRKVQALRLELLASPFRAFVCDRAKARRCILARALRCSESF